MYEVPIKWVFKGDRFACAAHMRRGAVLMDMLESFMGFQGLKQGVLRRWVTPDTLIECDMRFGLRTVTITVTPASVGEERREEKRGVPLLVAVSDSTGILLYGVEDWETTFSKGVPLHGYYEPIPDEYVVGANYYYWRNLEFPATRTGMETRPVDASVDASGNESTIRKVYLSTRYGPLYEWAYLNAQNPTLDVCGCQWCRPVLMPWAGKDVLSAFVTRYGGEDEYPPNGYRPIDALSLSEISLGPYDGLGRGQAKCVELKRGTHMYTTHGDIGPVAPLPERNGVRRYVTMRWGGEGFRNADEDPTLFRLVSFRGKGDVRAVDFKASLFAEHCPEWLRPCLYAEAPLDGSYFHPMGYWASEDEESGELHVRVVLYFNGSDSDFQDDGERRRWGMCLCRFVVPAAVADLTGEAEETALLGGTRVEDVVTSEGFLPLLDMLARENKARFYNFLNGREDNWYDDIESESRILAGTAQRPDGGWDDDRPVNYTVGGVIYEDVDGVPYNIADPGTMTIRWYRAYRLGLYLFSRDHIADCKALFQRGDTAYSWTRIFGGVALTPDGLFRQEMEWPQVIAEDVRARPNVTYAGGGLWCCVCERMGERVVGVYIGAPFDGDGRSAGWTEIPLVTAEWAADREHRIVHVRPLLVTAARVVLLAIVRDTDEKGTVRYRAAVGDGRPGTESTLLKFMGRIPLEREDEGMSWDICALDREEEYYRLQTRYPTPPVADKADGYNRSETPYLVNFPVSELF